MTPRQREALDFITGYCREHGCSPSLDEVRAALGLKSKSSVARLIEGLEAGGHIGGLHASGKQANEPCIPYVRADALVHALDAKEAAEAERDIAVYRPARKPAQAGMS